MEEKAKNVGLFVTCLVDLFRPSVAFAAVKLMSEAGCDISVPERQTCCGQPAFNSGDMDDSRAMAQMVIEEFEKFDYVVAPSGSCAAMIVKHYPELFSDQPDWHKRALDLSAKTFELLTFLSDVLKVKEVKATLDRTVTYHDSCSGLRELGIKDQPRKLLQSVEGVELIEAEQAERCCGFGGTFCLKYSDISARISDDKCEDLLKTGAKTVLGGDLGCLMNIAGRMTRRGETIEVRHIAEVLADMTGEVAPISQSKE
ncbi:Lactate utilization protein A [Candidatus Terasakiella magnetica]|uniref:Lactate utilization protein A n=1 Tax=Candidatus Terasakiella magnetica TaxID=1867952 RepID=A0A1C3RG90_9PROT|nr:(Fe-S)-binding protein [Candidatus Terasakiella magnetica]SCA56317.1 Lactate utilization protein A [Candidatus Terasakiella magnetica]